MSKEKEKRDFSADLEINQYALDIECTRHPSVYLKYADERAEKLSERDRLENKLALARADADTAFRESPGEKKITEAMVAVAVAQDSDVVSIGEEILEINAEIYHLDAAVKALEHKKSELDNLVQLWIKGYYSAPSGGKPSADSDTRADVRKNLKEKNTKNRR